MIAEQLKNKFGDCKFAGSSQCSIKSSYHFIDDEVFYIFDSVDAQPVQVRNDGAKQLTVLNSSKSEICLVKTDNCLFTSEISKCDCVLISDKKFYFVEIKSGKTGNRKDKRNKAVHQLGATIEHFVNNEIDISARDAKAIICFKSERDYPVSASTNSKRAIFQEKYKVSLEEGNNIEF